MKSTLPANKSKLCSNARRQTPNCTFTLASKSSCMYESCNKVLHMLHEATPLVTRCRDVHDEQEETPNQTDRQASAGAKCVQISTDSRNSAHHRAYRNSLRPSLRPEPRHPPLQLICSLATVSVSKQMHTENDESKLVSKKTFCIRTRQVLLFA